jgi:elongation factor G
VDDLDVVDFDLDERGTLTVAHATPGEGKYIKEVRGAGAYGHIRVLISPNQGPREYRFEWQVQQGRLPLAYARSASLEGVKAALAKPLVGGERISRVLVAVVEGSYHDTDTTPVAIRMAAIMAVQAALSRAKLVPR